VPPDALTVVHRLDDRQIVELHSLYQSEWWTRGRTLDDTRRCVSGSQVVVGLVDGAGNLRAFARVITDFTFKALIFDVIVSAGARKNGLGDRLLEVITRHDKLRHVRHFELYCLPELFTFYNRHGFSENVGEVQLMRRVTS
jgi:predicted GNAT family N-acyltransferase